MRAVIVYATKTGATKQCAELLAERLPGAELHDLERSTPDLAGFGMVLIGSGVRVKTLYEPARAFMTEHEEELLTKQVAIFICNFYPETFQETIQNNIPERLRQHALCVTPLGGKRPFSDDPGSSWIRYERVDALVAEVSSALRADHTTTATA